MRAVRRKGGWKDEKRLSLDLHKPAVRDRTWPREKLRRRKVTEWKEPAGRREASGKLRMMCRFHGCCIQPGTGLSASKHESARWANTCWRATAIVPSQTGNASLTGSLPQPLFLVCPGLLGTLGKWQQLPTHNLTEFGQISVHHNLEHLTSCALRFSHQPTSGSSEFYFSLSSFSSLYFFMVNLSSHFCHLVK